MKKYLYILSVLILIFFGINKISAVTTCEYNNGLVLTYDDGGNASFDYPDSSPKTVKWLKDNLNWILKILSVDLEEGLEATSNVVHQPENLDGSCPAKLYYCDYKSVQFAGGIAAVILRENIQLKYEMYIYHSKQDVTGEKKFDGEPHFVNELLEDYRQNKKKRDEEYAKSEENCGVIVALCKAWDNIVYGASNVGDTLWQLFEIIGGDASQLGLEEGNCRSITYSGENSTYNASCIYLESYSKTALEEIEHYKTCGEDASCILETKNNVDAIEDKIKKYCGVILEKYNYDGDNDQECIESCLAVKDKLREAKKNAGFLLDANGECGLTESIIYWIANIIKWLKYIVPVLVIVFGMLDFIKAIGADKDDEIKKAQGRFVRRLIAAALIFLVPLIIGFILHIAGFDANGCGIISL